MINIHFVYCSIIVYESVGPYISSISKNVIQVEDYL